ncbi:hypothetical protein NEILACOT_03616 [Neisseria lactamica ATCC 23970]|uniref:Uncharacterized protein n=1 Tax=Neisseria lactamica ATCC 23970 TaxID=546265 RepID=D0W7W6_NEILA|nr:hypothetical protein NEILACOT_03616 [Neisseria lactamica ATCC 23970]
MKQPSAAPECRLNACFSDGIALEGKQGFKGFGKRVAPVFFIKLLGNIGRNRTGRMRTVL